MNNISAQAMAIRSSLVKETLDDTSISDKRSAWEQHAKTLSLPEHIESEIANLGNVACAIHKPRDTTDRNPIVYFHGGGLVEGSSITAREWCARLAAASQRAVICPDYRLAPEHPYPAATDDAFAVCAAVQESTQFNAIAGIGADSTGSVLALNTLLELKNQHRPQPSSCFLLSPSIDLSFSARSVEYNATNDLFVSEEVMRHYAILYAPHADLRSPRISPLFAELGNLAPMLVLVDQSELLLDDATRLVENVRKHHGTIDLYTSQGLWHCWPTWAAFPEADAALERIVEHLHSCQQA